MSWRKGNRFLPCRTSRSLIREQCFPELSHRVGSLSSTSETSPSQHGALAGRSGPGSAGPGLTGDLFSRLCASSVSLFQFGICLNVGFIIPYHRQAPSAGQGVSATDCSRPIVSGVTLGGGELLAFARTRERTSRSWLTSWTRGWNTSISWIGHLPTPESASPATHAMGQEESLQSRGILSPEKKEGRDY